MGIKETRKAVEDLVTHRGEDAEQMWRMMSGFDPSVTPSRAVLNLRGLTEMLRRLVVDIENVIKNPPLP